MFSTWMGDHPGRVHSSDLLIEVYQFLTDTYLQELLAELCNPAYMGAISVYELVQDGYASVLSIQLHGIDNGYISKAED